MTGILCASFLMGLYLWARRRYHHRFPQKSPSRARVLYFALGCAALALTLCAPLDALADRSFTWHMLQHLGILLVAPPLLLLGAPLLYVLGALPQEPSRRLSRALRAQPLATLLSPVPAWLCYVAVQWISHFSGLYNAALQNELVHGLEHGLYFGFALLFWSAVVQTGFVAHPVPFEGRLLYVFLAIPQGAFLGLALYQTRVVLYAHYAALQSAAAALADQHNAGALMWMGGGLLMFAAFVITAALWAAHEREPKLRYGT